MDTMFSDYSLTAVRVAELLCVPPPQQEALLEYWHRERRDSGLDPYARARNVIGAFHRRELSIGEIRYLVDDWQVAAIGSLERRQASSLVENARAVTDYLAHHESRELTILDPTTLEAVVARVRIVIKPHLHALVGPAPTFLWLDCTPRLDELRAIARCRVTHWVARPRIECAVEYVHAATPRLIADVELPRSFDHEITRACETAHRIWSALDMRDRFTARELD